MMSKLTIKMESIIQDKIKSNNLAVPHQHQVPYCDKQCLLIAANCIAVVIIVA